MARTSAGLLMYRLRKGQLEVLLVHPGGPFWRSKDEGVWTIPKGEIQAGELPLDAAIREFSEETSLATDGPYLPLTPVRQKAGKIVQAWAFQGDCDPSRIESSRFDVEWPPHSRQHQSFPEIDRVAFFDLDTARRKINPAQVALIEELERALQT